MKNDRPGLFSKATDLWHVGIAHVPIARFLHPESTLTTSVTWLPLSKPFSFIADPFAVRDAGGGLTVLVEALDYRSKRGEIHFYRFDDEYELYETGCAVKHQTHLSYPFLIEHEGAVFMLPEAHRTGQLTLYRATEFPYNWNAVSVPLALPAIDASMVYYEHRWWMFFALPGKNGHAMNAMYIAYADSLTGKWHLHDQIPARRGLDACRIGGTPFVNAGQLYLPIQDCSRSYGGSLKIYQVNELTPSRFNATPVSHLFGAQFHPEYNQGIHTLSACGDLTLFDVKRVEYSPKRYAIDFERRLTKWMTRERRTIA